MRFGVHVFPTEFSIQPDELARAAEERGLDSVWFSEHTHIPVRFLNEPGPRYPLPDHYWQTYDIFVAMMLAAAVTTRVKVASGVALVIEHDPIILAKQVATLDRISRGRFIFGIGAGWLESEMADHGVAYRTRFQLLKERLRAMQAIWTADESEFHGRFVNFDKMRAFPKPFQHPHPPLIMGGEHDKALEIAAELCDGWAPWGMAWPQAKQAIVDLRKRAAAHGRDPASLEISLFDRTLPDQATLDDMQSAGVSRFIFSVLGEGRDVALPRLDRLAKGA